MMKNRGDEFSAMNDYVNAFGEKLAVLERISQRIVREQYGEINCCVTSRHMQGHLIYFTYLHVHAHTHTHTHTDTYTASYIALMRLD